MIRKKLTPQVLQPENPVPPHCSYLAAAHPAAVILAPADFVEVGVAGLVVAVAAGLVDVLKVDAAGLLPLASPPATGQVGLPGVFEMPPA